MPIPARAPVEIPPAEIPGPGDWFVWDAEPPAPTTDAALVCFRSWLAPGRWAADLAAICHHAA
jgi:hypothetical protein